MELYGYGPLTDAIASLNLDAEFGCNPPFLGKGLGVEDGRIPDSSLTSSSIYGSGYETYRGRLNNVTGAWAPAYKDKNKWIKVDLGEDTSVTGVITQGEPTANYMVTSFQISYSRDDKNWAFALEEHCGVRKVSVICAIPFKVNFVLKFTGNYDRGIHVTHTLARPVVGRSFRIYPKTKYNQFGLRMELYGYGPLTDAIACRSNPCFNGGNCTETDAGFTCLCLGGYRGERCAEVSLYQQSVMFVALGGQITDSASAGASTDEDSYSEPLNVAVQVAVGL
eukprot:XP_011670683.1 PREDICTED: lactadherin-like [Strongylocentrotus purpuratus]